MEKLSKALLEELLAVQTAPAVTIYMPTQMSAAPPHLSENQIRFKNLLHEAADKVKEAYGHQELASQLLEKIDQYRDNVAFWSDQSAGLLICATPDRFRMFHLPIDTEEYVAADVQFHLAPLMGIMHDFREFYVLALAQQDPVLYKGTMYGLEHAGIELPSNAQDALNIDEANTKSENQGTARGTSLDPAWFNGRGGGKDPTEEDRMRYFRLVDHQIYEKADRSLPLVLAGVDSETVEFRGISKYSHLLEGTISGNHTSTQPQDLFAQAQTIVRKELVLPEHQSAIEEYSRLSGANPSRIAKDVSTIAEAAKQGRIDKLLAAMSRRTTDTVRDQSEAVPRITFPEASEDRRQLNEIARTVWETSGTVINLEPDEMPQPALMLARLRY